MKWTIYLILLFPYLSCNGQNHKSQFLSYGVILSTNGSVFWEDTISLFNQDESLYAKIWTDKNGKSIVDYSDTTRVRSSIAKSVKENYPRSYVGNGGLPKISVRFFDDGYDSPLMVFDAKQLASGNQVFVNGEWRKIKYSKPLVYKEWDAFMLEVYIGLGQDNPLRLTRNEEGSDIIENYEKYYYEVIEVDGDWLKVRCWSDCEGCPDDGTIINGWVKWRDKGKLLVKLYYIC